MALDAGPARCHEHCDRKVAIRNVLLVAEILICGHEDFITGKLRLSQKFTVLQCAPAELKDGGDNMVSQKPSKRYRRALIEQDAHLGDFQ